MFQINLNVLLQSISDTILFGVNNICVSKYNWFILNKSISQDEAEIK